jgi:hypothetical protein
VRRFLRLARKECSRPWFDTYVAQDGVFSLKKAAADATRRLKKVRERFKAGDDEPDTVVMADAVASALSGSLG